MSGPVYLDYNATAPVKPDVIDAMAEAMATVGNPSSVHGPGRAVRRMISRAREQVAALVGARPEQVIFTSGGTEANNQALLGYGRPILASAIEHPSVLALGDDYPPLAVDRDGVIDLVALQDRLDRAKPAALAVMLANNETGALQPVPEVAAMARSAGVPLHVDAIQAAGKIPVDLTALGADTLSLSAHKVGGPQGVGALVTRPGLEPPGLFRGGSQERRLRAGTENVPGIVGFGMAAALALDDQDFAPRVEALRDRLEAELLALAPETKIFAGHTARLPNTACLALPGLGQDTQLIAFDLAGIAVSSGAACSSGKVGPSHVLAAMGVPPDDAASAIRISFGWNSQHGDVDRFLDASRDLLARRHRRLRA